MSIFVFYTSKKTDKVRNHTRAQEENPSKNCWPQQGNGWFRNPYADDIYHHPVVAKTRLKRMRWTDSLIHIDKEILLGKSIKTISMVQKEDITTVPQMEGRRRPWRRTTFKDIKLVDPRPRPRARQRWLFNFNNFRQINLMTFPLIYLKRLAGRHICWDCTG